MSITIKMSGHDGSHQEHVVNYQYGDHVLLARHITCKTVADRYAKNYIRLLEEDRAKSQGDLF